MATERKNQFQFELESNPLHKNALKGEAWIRKIYRDLVFKVCKDCGEPYLGSKQICSTCETRRAEELRWKDCECGNRFRLEDGQSRGTRVCPACKEDDYDFFYNRAIQYFNHRFYPRAKTEEERMYKYASKSRNDIQSTTGYANFKMMYEFENVDWRVDNTWEHINSMTFLIYNFLKRCTEDPVRKNYNYAKNYLLKYGVQFRTSAAQNYALVPFQTSENGVTPEQYISIVGNIKGKTKEETIDIIKKHFINHG